MSGIDDAPTLTLRQTVQAAPRWARLYLPSAGLDQLVEAVWTFSFAWEAARLGWASGLVLAAGGVPAVIFVLWGGSLSDRLGAHRVAVWTMLARVIMMAAWAAVIIFGLSSPLAVAGIAAVLGAISGIHDPAVSSMPMLLVPRAGLEASTNTQRSLTRIVQGVGPALGGLTASLLGMGAVVVGAAVIGIIPLAFLAVLRQSRSAADESAGTASGAETSGTETQWQAMTAGLRWVMQRPAFRATVLVQAVLGLASASAVIVALPRQARAQHWGPDVYGWAFSAFGIGLLVGSLIGFPLRTRWPRRRAAIGVGSAAVSSVFVAVAGMTDLPGVAIIGAGLMGLTLGPVGALLTGWTTASAAAEDPKLYGRVFAVLLLATTAAEPLGFLIFSAIVAAVGSVAIASVIVGLAGVVVSVVALAIRDIRLTDA